jgi:hypothetical protein
LKEVALGRTFRKRRIARGYEIVVRQSDDDNNNNY